MKDARCQARSEYWSRAQSTTRVLSSWNAPNVGRSRSPCGAGSSRGDRRDLHQPAALRSAEIGKPVGGPKRGKAVHPSRNHVLDRRRRCLVPDAPVVATDLHQVRRYAAKVGMAHVGSSWPATCRLIFWLPKCSALRRSLKASEALDVEPDRRLQIAHGQHEMIRRGDHWLSLAQRRPQAGAMP
jgi:hypothetical protein